MNVDLTRLFTRSNARSFLATDADEWVWVCRVRWPKPYLLSNDESSKSDNQNQATAESLGWYSNFSIELICIRNASKHQAYSSRAVIRTISTSDTICARSWLSSMRKISSNAVLERTATVQRKFRFRAFYITVLCLSFLAAVSLLADQSARYRYGPQYGLAQRRALDQLDPGRLVKRDEEVRQLPILCNSRSNSISFY